MLLVPDVETWVVTVARALPAREPTAAEGFVCETTGKGGEEEREGVSGEMTTVEAPVAETARVGLLLLDVVDVRVPDASQPPLLLLLLLLLLVRVGLLPPLLVPCGDLVCRGGCDCSFN